MKSAQEWIKELGLVAHPEGGFYKEMYRSTENVDKKSLPERYKGSRSFATSIYFLLRSEDISAFHRIKSDELWFYHAGCGLDVLVLDDSGLHVFKLGSNSALGQSMQLTIPQGKWFAAECTEPESYTLVSCLVAPGFDFEDFELAKKEELVSDFPNFEKIITKFTKN